ncbi:hypothetical protein CAPTEDRAFT_191168 [Capitella teleta]|uniref:Uncharacterized protein n=1 Tax=Capitella teleta TaxID=283909 RepID=R7UA93_CAPTE|nr:hypothetical protein CAPTEDRAFT_191168 [Capitella teleta]|eukprot:ELU02889.1 hypothetical protein CAPTEDRAFT_191168 [Capitella teleta]
MILGQPPARIRPPPEPHWLKLDYGLSCNSEKGVIEQPSEHSASRGDPETERVRYIIVVVLAVMTVVCIGLTFGLVYLKRRYLKYQIHPDAPSEETNFLWNYRIRGLRWTRYRSSEQPPPQVAVPSTPIRPEFTEMALELKSSRGTKQGPASIVRLELRERCSTSSGISLSNSDVQEEPPDLVTSTLQPQMRPSIAELGEMMQCLAEGRLEDEENEEAAAIHEAPTLQLQRPLRQPRPVRDEVMPHAQTEEPNCQRRRRRRRQPRRRPPQPSSPSSSSPCSTLPRSRPPPKRSSSGHRRHSRSLGYETDNEIEV